MPTLISGSTGVNKITDGTIVDADVTDVAASKLTGTIADARFPSTLPAASAANLTAIPAANITGTLPAISGASLTSMLVGTSMFQAKGASSGGAWASLSTNTIVVMAGYINIDDSCYNTSDGKFTAPAAGTYFFYMNVYTAQDDSNNGFAFRKNDAQSGTTDAQGHATYSGVGTGDHHVSAQMVINLAASDTVSIYTSTGSDWYTGHSYWGGFRLN